jgi:hypothetical protein
MLEVIKHNELYCKLDFQIFIWDSGWDFWRPITKVGWNGFEITYDDSKYKKNIFDPDYGFGSSEMKELCKKLNDFIDKENFTSNIEKLFDYPEFLYDRKIGFLDSCSNIKNKDSWKKYLKYIGQSSKTLRKFIDCRKTRRLLIRKLNKNNGT